MTCISIDIGDLEGLCHGKTCMAKKFQAVKAKFSPAVELANCNEFVTIRFSHE